MSFTANNHLSVDPNVIVRDQQHAARLFADAQFRLAPKSKFLFHVAFGINSSALIDVSLTQKFGQEINMLVKSVDLPSYQVQTEVLNQYNRKKVMQYKHTPQEIQIKFHDDNMGLINKLWQNYYTYYYADPRASKVSGAYSRTAMRNSNYIPTVYGLDNGSLAPFFNYIKIYQMARHEYVCYQLYNPLITLWNHNKLDYAQNQVHDFDMKLNYEAVSYSVGAVSPDTVEGFGQTHYDHTPSPLQGINPDPNVYDPSFVSAFDIEGNAPSIINSVINQISSAQNSQAPTVSTGTTGLLTPAQINLGGLSGVSFPKAAAGGANAITVAIQSIGP
jgi:hypothetical protein